MALTWDPKDPDEVLDYVLDWTDRLAGDTITSSTWTIPVGSGLTLGTRSLTDTTTTVWLSAGVADVAYQLLNRIVTAGGRTHDQTVKLKVRQK
ncbi:MULTISPECIES: hypothetical protein [Mesorhizobium]|uniref:phage fiber-tail adaptor protein n=1 Tax=Mesorhizobium TaxID=68287 RepID=UPI0007A937D1|nr:MULTISPECIES: hypothetical protein [Mesorhizobium]AMX93620.1 hypothetical protein A4R28_11185 [Mesorhizobium ciceri]MDF3208311.1 hypothetical protein [Mesorhizobium sp. LMG15046]MDF3229117.1 hypothetical protein [Mesorhizobium sp. DSM 30133]RUU22225.1 hypothetical protein EOC84_03700 [Mesorhizobium sp. Primo-B]RUU37866.1 hypothetical protein EOC83_16515 [Mesorhizobium sp. Primo-A]